MEQVSRSKTRCYILKDKKSTILHAFAAISFYSKSVVRFYVDNDKYKRGAKKGIVVDNKYFHYNKKINFIKKKEQPKYSNLPMNEETTIGSYLNILKPFYLSQQKIIEENIICA